ncbi:MAG: hypothetical protein JWM11_6016 [Planctomycetaceae bacterium]|nr:hypothetical protein [Planctomycetaceae bacterium]
MAAAPTSKPGWVHYCCALFFICTLFLSIGLYLTVSGAKESDAARATAEKKASEATSASTRALEQITILKNTIGYTFETVGTADDKNANTVVGAMLIDIDAAKDPAIKSYRALLLKLQEQVNSDIQAIAVKDDDIKKKIETISLLEPQYQTKVTQEEAAKTEVQTSLTTATAALAEERTKKDKEIDDQRTALKALQEEYAKLEDEYKKATEVSDKTVKGLRDSIKRLNKKLEEITREDFDLPLGKIVEVDNDARSVTINLGSTDKLKPLQTFSVYMKPDAGTSGGSEDIKGSIKVTKIMGPHLALCAITTEILKANPISPGDPIFTPVWAPGQVEKFAFVGRFDLDGDGKHDQDLLLELLQNNGATLGAYVDQKGERHNGRVDFSTKYLVIGDIPDVTQIGDAEEKRAVEEIGKHRDKMKLEAEENGVKLVRLADFLRKTGYRPQHKLIAGGQLRRNKASIQNDDNPAFDGKLRRDDNPAFSK